MLIINNKFYFYCSPSLLNLTFPYNLVHNQEEKINSYDYESMMLNVSAQKEEYLLWIFGFNFKVHAA